MEEGQCLEGSGGPRNWGFIFSYKTRDDSTEKYWRSEEKEIICRSQVQEADGGLDLGSWSVRGFQGPRLGVWGLSVETWGVSI